MATTHITVENDQSWLPEPTIYPSAREMREEIEAAVIARGPAGQVLIEWLTDAEIKAIVANMEEKIDEIASVYDEAVAEFRMAMEERDMRALIAASVPIVETVVETVVEPEPKKVAARRTAQKKVAAPEAPKAITTG